MPGPTPLSPGIDTLIELLERQRTLVSELSALATQQSSLIAEARTDALLELLSRRQEIIEHFSVAQRELGVLIRRAEALRGWRGIGRFAIGVLTGPRARRSLKWILRTQPDPVVPVGSIATSLGPQAKAHPPRFRSG